MNQVKALPTISVITPSFNQGRFLRQCIESVLAQVYSNLEFMIIDGGSTDETLSVIREYESSISYWISESDSGQSDAINKGFRRASGEIVSWLNADDYYLPGAFDSVVDAYSADPSAPFYFGDGLRVNETGAVIANFFPMGTLAFDRQALVMGLNYILQPSTFINRRSLERAGYLDTELHFGMDSDLWMRLSALGAPRVVPLVLAATREYATTKTASGSFARIEELRKISMKYSGLPITPGVLCYFLDTLHRFVQQRGDLFPEDYLKDVDLFWQKTSDLLERYNARSDGFPRISKEPRIAQLFPNIRKHFVKSRPDGAE
jgi:glycosyltransferase involved in cell wall biosynthesis